MILEEGREKERYIVRERGSERDSERKLAKYRESKRQ